MRRLVLLASLFVAIVTLALGAAGTASATCAIPNTLTNGTTADATQVMANFNALATCISTGGGSGVTVVAPQGRLTLASGAAVMTTDAVAKSTIYYDCYAGTLVPYYDGVRIQVDVIPSCEASLTMPTFGTGVTNPGGVFDVWWVHAGANRICVATNGSGGGWASDTGGSNTARGTGYSQVHNTLGYWTNANALTDCYNGGTDYGSVAADQATYLGSIYTTAAGQTTFNTVPSPTSGGTNNCVCIYNAYNHVPVISVDTDNAANWTVSLTGYQPADNSTNNRVSWVDGLQQDAVVGVLDETFFHSIYYDMFFQVMLDSATSPGTPPDNARWGCGNDFSNMNSAMELSCAFPPQMGFHFLQPMEGNNGGGGYTMQSIHYQFALRGTY